MPTVFIVGRTVIFLLVAVVQLRQHFLQSLRNRQANVGRVLQQRKPLVSSLMVNFLCRIDPIKTAQSGINSNCVIVFFQLSVNLSDKIEQDPHILFFLTIDNVNVANLDPFDKATHKL